MVTHDTGGGAAQGLEEGLAGSWPPITRRERDRLIGLLCRVAGADQSSTGARGGGRTVLGRLGVPNRQRIGAWLMPAMVLGGAVLAAGCVIMALHR